jgi:hypothetical protein
MHTTLVQQLIPAMAPAKMAKGDYYHQEAWQYHKEPGAGGNGFAQAIEELGQRQLDPEHVGGQYGQSSF